MKLKTYIYTLIVFGTMGILSSCSDWLDYTPKDKETEAQTFSSKQGFYTAINGVYNRISDDVLYGQNMTYGMIDIMGRRYSTPSSLRYTIGSQRIYASLISSYSYTDTDFQTLIESIWEEAYATILNINVILDNAEQKRGSVLTEDDYNIIKGDMLALRAFLHFDMLRMFGPVYSRNPEKICIPYNDSREAQVYEQLSARSVIYDHLIPDLEAAEECLAASDPIIAEGPLASSVEGEDNYTRYRQLRLNYYAVILLKARIYLWAGDKTNALAEARRLTDDSQVSTWFPFINPDHLLGNTVDPDRTFSTECLFGFYDSNRDLIFTTFFDASNLTASALYQPRNGYVSGLYSNTNDYRYRSQWSISGSSHSLVKFNSIEISEDEEENNSYPFYTYFMPLMRLSEAYYIVAECLTDTDPASARAYMDVIMSARGRQPLAEDITSEALLEEIKLEYMREMAGEGQVFFMLKRFFQRLSGNYDASSTGSTAASDTRYEVPLPESELINR